MHHRLERAVPLGGEFHPLPGFGPVAKGEHLLAREHDAHRTLELQCAHHRQNQLVLRPQARAKSAADKGVFYRHLVLGQAKYLRHHPAAVLRTLRLVVDRQVAVVRTNHGAGVHFHRVVVLHATVEVGVDAHRRGFIGRIGIARGFWWR